MATDDRLVSLAEIQRIVTEMRNERPRYKSHDLGFVDSVSASRVDEWADELEAALAASSRPQEDATTEGRVCPRDGGMCWGPCEVAHCQHIADAVASPTPAPKWQFAAEDYEAEAHRHSGGYVGVPCAKLIALLAEAAARLREDAALSRVEPPSADSLDALEQAIVSGVYATTPNIRHLIQVRAAERQARVEPQEDR